jgi:hypothetical protein
MLSFQLDAMFGSSMKPMRGVFKETPLLKLHHFDPTAMVPVEVMHTFDLGIIKYFLKLWTGTSKKKQSIAQPQITPVIPPWELTSDQKNELERRLNSVRLPHYFSRHLLFNQRDSWKDRIQNFWALSFGITLRGLITRSVFNTLVFLCQSLSYIIQTALKMS